MNPTASDMKHRDVHGQILHVGDRVQLSHVVCGDNEHPPCHSRIGTILSFDLTTPSAVVSFETPIEPGLCFFNDFADLTSQPRGDCVIMLIELSLVETRCNEPQQTKIEAWLR